MYKQLFLALSLSALSLSASSTPLLDTHAFTPYHKHHNVFPTNTNIQAKNEVQDFSGVWTGNCFDEQLHLTIKQNDKQVTLDFLDQDGDIESFTFDINKLMSHHDSELSKSEASLNHALFSSNVLTLSSLNITTDDQLFIARTMDLTLFKEGNTLKILRDNDPSCTLNK